MVDWRRTLAKWLKRAQLRNSKPAIEFLTEELIEPR